MQLKMNAFWNVHGTRYCADNGFLKINKKDDVEDESKMMHEDTLCIINLDNSGSMSPGSITNNGKYANAVRGAKTAEAFLRGHHTNPSQVQVHLWQNDCPGVQCVYTGNITQVIPDDKWKDADSQPSESKVVQRSGVYAEGQFHGSINILRYSAVEALEARKRQGKDYP